jgi:membrane-associated phospholipid phosphatase
MYLGVHFPSDVLAGWVIGAALLFGFFVLAEQIEAWFSKFSLSGQVLWRLRPRWCWSRRRGWL